APPMQQPTTADGEPAESRDGARARARGVASRDEAAPTAGGEPVAPESPRDDVRTRARGVVGRDDAAPWLHPARADAAAAPGLPALAAGLAGGDPLLAFAERLAARAGRGDPPSGAWRPRPAADLAADIAAAGDALRPLEPLLRYQLVVGRAGG